MTPFCDVNLLMLIIVSLIKSEGRAVYEQNPFLAHYIPSANKTISTEEFQRPPVYQQAAVPIGVTNNNSVNLVQEVPLIQINPQVTSNTIQQEQKPSIYQQASVAFDVTNTNSLNEMPVSTIQSGHNLRNLCIRARGQFPTNRCNMYINCWDDSIIEQVCPEGLAFNPAGYCDFIHNVDCGTRSLEGSQSIPISQNLEQQFVTALPGSWISPTGPPPKVELQPEYLPPVPSGNTRLRMKCLKTRGQFPTDSCEKYVDCWEGNAIEQDCPPGLHFSEKGYCDYAHNVNCYNRTATKTSHNTQTSACPQPDGTFRDQTNCSRFFTCIANIVVAKQECPFGLRYNNLVGVCDYANQVICVDEMGKSQEQKPEYPPKLPTEALHNTQTSACPQPDGTFRDKTNCSRFFTCIANIVVAKQECPFGLRYNNFAGVCDYAYQVNCVDEVDKIPEQKTEYPPQLSTETPLSISLECSPGKVFRLNTNCSSAILCRKEITEVIHCPAGLTYDAPTDRCLSPTIARCNDQ